MKTQIARIILAVAGFVFFTSFAAATTDLQSFDPKIAPTKAEWQHFNRMTDKEVMNFWRFNQERGARGLRDWSWQWRMGWIKRCASGLKDSMCKGVLLDGLLDNAMVIRAEAATSLGKRFAGKASSEIMVALQNAYVDPRNSRNGNPLYVYERILEALSKLDDPRAVKIATKLANSHDETKAYWGAISKR